jgi:MYXO-CTERM domain-containing protein
MITFEDNYTLEELEELEQLEFLKNLFKRLKKIKISFKPKIKIPKIKWGLPRIKIGKFHWKMTPKQALIGAGLITAGTTGLLPAIGTGLIKTGGELFKKAGKAGEFVKGLLKSKQAKSFIQKMLKVKQEQPEITTQAIQPQPEPTTNWLLPLLGLGALFFLARR